MWMPPGRHEISPSVNGEAMPMTINVTRALAENFNRRLQQMRASAASGFGDEPYIDLNHNDAEAAGQVTELFWGGDDPKTGGIRARVNWSAAGREALLGRNYRRFSPQWDLDPNTFEPINIGPNLGGLVNRAAFTSMAPIVTAKGGRRSLDLMAYAQEVADRKNIPLAQAIQDVCRANDALYRQATGHAPKGNQRKAHFSAAAKDMSDDLIVAAKEYATTYGITETEAVRRLMTTDPEFASAYRNEVLGTRGTRK